MHRHQGGEPEDTPRHRVLPPVPPAHAGPPPRDPADSERPRL